MFVELSSLDGVLRACAVPYRLADFLVIVVCRAAVSRVSSFGFAVAFPVVVKLAAISSMVSACLPRDGTMAVNLSFHLPMAPEVQDSESNCYHDGESYEDTPPDGCGSVDVDQGVGGVVLRETSSSDLCVSVDVRETFYADLFGFLLAIPEHVGYGVSHGLESVFTAPVPLSE